MDFMTHLEKESTKQLTENGAIGYATSGKDLVDFNFKIPAFRKNEKELYSALAKVLASGDPYVLKFMFYLRDARSGLGERDAFRKAIMEVMKSVELSDVDRVSIFKLVPEFGRWDDLFIFVDTEYENDVMSIVKAQFMADLNALEKSTLTNAHVNVSLLAKWMPSDNASAKRSRYLAHKFATYFGLSIRAYRKCLVNLRNYLNVVEQKTCANQWSEIDYSLVPSNANIRYKEAFLKHDAERRQEFLKRALGGDTTAKVHSAVNFPHEIVSRYTEDRAWDRVVRKYDMSLEALWENLPDMPGLSNTLVVRDGSGSMTCQVNAHTCALDIADALTLYCADRCVGPYKNKFITFSSRPQFVDVSGKANLHDKLRYLCTFDDCSNTNLEATFDLILRTAVENNLSQEELPKQVLIVSDMEFDCVSYSSRRHSSKALMEVIAQKFEDAGYKLPKLVFWNVNGRTNTIPMQENEMGVILVSGFSVQALNVVLSGEYDPYKAILKVLDSPRYEAIPLVKVI